MIPSQYRLRLNGRCRFTGKKQSFSWITVVYSPAAVPQWSVRVSKKIDSRATARNKLRRQINFWLLKQAAKLQPTQFLVIVKKYPRSHTELNALYAELGRAHVFTQAV